MDFDEIRPLRAEYTEQTLSSEELVARREDWNRRKWREDLDDTEAIIEALKYYATSCPFDNTQAVCEALIKRIERDGILLKEPRDDDY